MTIELKNKLYRFGLITLAIVLILFLIIFNGAYWGVNTPHGRDGVLSVLLSTFIPFLVSMCCILASGYFKTFGKKEAIAQNEKQYRNGLIDNKHYKENWLHIEMFDMEKREMEATIEMEKQKIINKVEQEARKKSKELKDKAKEVSNE